MKKSLSDFAKTPIKDIPQTTQTLPKPSPQEKENLEQLAQKYQNMSRDELMQTFYAEVAKQKTQGTFNLDHLQQSIDNLDAFLNPEQKKNIKELLKNL